VPKKERTEALKHATGPNVNDSLVSLHEGRISASETVIADPKPQTHSERHLENQRKRDSDRALSSSTMSEGSAPGDKPDTSSTLNKDIDSLFG
jgi:hypothetical protein